METELTISENNKPKSKVSNTVNYVKDLLAPSPQGMSGVGLEMGIGTVLARTALKRLPAPFNVVVPLAMEKVILKYGIPEGREILLRGLRWVKKATDEKPVVIA